MKIKKQAYYQMKYPMNTFQEKAHVTAMRKTVEELKGKGIGVTQAQIMQVLSVVHIYIVYTATNMYKNKKKEDPSVIKTWLGYFRTIFTSLFITMKDNGEFTKEEFDIIRNEFYKKEFDIYYNILNNTKHG